MRIVESDVIVLGTGMAGTAAALAANEHGARVVVLDKAPREWAGGSTRLSAGGWRAAMPGYTADDQYNDVMLVTGGRADPAITRHVVDNGEEAMRWLESNGMVWVDAKKAGRPGLTGRRVQPYRSKPIPIEFGGMKQLGFGNGAIQLLHKTLLDRVEVRFDTKAESLLLDEQHRICGVKAYDADGYLELHAPTVIVATGGFQANVEWRVRYFGSSASDWIVRGSRFSTGDGLRMLIDIGAAPEGQWGGYHTPIVDARSARLECGETNINQYHYTVMLNVDAKRFVDEGADWGDRTIIRYGRQVLAQPTGVACLVYDQKVAHLVGGNTEELGPYVANDLDELAGMLGLNPPALAKTIAEYNAAVQPGDFDPEALDGKGTQGLELPKSNWAMTIDTPPYYGYRVTGGLTYGFGGIKVDPTTRVINTEGHVIEGLYAAGEIIGGLFYDAYPGGSSLTYATVLGRTAGTMAADAAKDRVKAEQ